MDPRAILASEGAAGLRDVVSIDEVAAAWCRYAERDLRRGQDARPDWEGDPDGWAMEIYFEEEFWDIPRRKRFLSLIAALAPNDDVLLLVGAQGLEDFITDEEDRLAWAEEQAALSGNFRKALQNVYVSGLAPNSVTRLERAAGWLRYNPR
jgi:hypothetical protein